MVEGYAKEDIIIDGITYPKGSKVSFPEQLGIDDLISRNTVNVVVPEEVKVEEPKEGDKK